MEYPGPFNLLHTEPITVFGHTTASHWNMCWRGAGEHREHTHRKALTTPNVEDYCYYVNGLCFIWASPCSGGCSNVTIADHLDFCPTLRYATESEWNAADLNSFVGIERAAFWFKCAASFMDPLFIHCDFANNFSRVPNNHWDELILVCPATSAPTPAPTASGGEISAIGDPHLQNFYGERFDLMKPGKHVLINIPRGTNAEDALLRVRADARHLGGQCSDMYFQELNITGEWVKVKANGTEGLRFQAQGVYDEQPKWLTFGKVKVKVAHGRTQNGLRYLNFYVKNLGHCGFAPGGLLGEDDHTVAATPTASCLQRVSLLNSGEVDGQGTSVASSRSFAHATFA